MKKSICVLLIGVFAFSLSAFSKSSGDFTKHNIGFHVTPSADYLIYRQGDIDIEDPYEGLYPFIGFSFGAEYIYRPVEVFGVSTGLQMDMQGLFFRAYGHTFSGTRFVSARTNYHELNLSVPIYFHLYKQMTACAFEFAVGPEFNFPVLERWATTYYSSTGEKVDKSHGKDKKSASEIKDLAHVGLSIFLGGVRTISDNVDLFIGPQIQFQDLAYLNKGKNDDAKGNGKYFPVTLGVKLGFRFHK